MSNSNLAVSLLINARDEASAVFDKVKGKFLAFAAVIGGGALFGSAVSSSAEFEKAMDGVASKLGGTEEEMQKLTAAALAVGESGEASAIQAAAGLETLVASGLSADAAITALLPALRGAKAEGLDLEATAGMITSTMGQMGLSVDQATRILDVFTKTGQLSNTNAAEVAEAFKQTGAMAKAAGLSLEEAAGALDVLANAGIRGGEAGTALRNILGMLMDPASKARLELGKLGDVSGNFASALDTISAAGMRGESAIQAFGVEVGPALRAFVAAGTDDLNRFIGELQNAGGTIEFTSKVMTDNFLGAFNKLGTVFEAIKIKLMAPLLAPLKAEIDAFVSWLQSVAGSKALTDFGNVIASSIQIAIQTVREFVQTADWSAIGQSVSNFAANAKTSLAEFSSDMSAIGNVVSVIVNGITGAIKTLLTPFVALGAGLVMVYAEMVQGAANFGLASRESADQAAAAAQSMKDRFTALQQSAVADFQTAGAAVVTLADNMTSTADQVATAADQVTQSTVNMATATENAFAGDKAEAADRLSRAAAAYALALAETGTAAGDSAAQQAVLKTNLESAKQAFDGVSQQFDAYAAAQTAATDATDAYDQALANYNAALEKAKNGNVEAAFSLEELQKKLDAARLKATESSAALEQLGTSSTTANDGIKSTGAQADITKAKIAELTDEYNRLMQAGDGEGAAALKHQIDQLNTALFGAKDTANVVSKEVVEAMKRLGFDSQAALDELVAQAQVDFEAISKSQGAMSLDAKNAFLGYAQAKVDAAVLYSDAQQREIDADLRRQAALLGVGTEYESIAGKIDNATKALERESAELKRESELLAASHSLKSQEIKAQLDAANAAKALALAKGDTAAAGIAANDVARLSAALAVEESKAAKDAAQSALANAQALQAKANAALAAAQADGLMTAAEIEATAQMQHAADMAQVQAESLDSAADAKKEAAKAAAAAGESEKEATEKTEAHNKATDEGTKINSRYGGQLGITMTQLGDLAAYYDVAMQASNQAINALAKSAQGHIYSLEAMYSLIKAQNTAGVEAGLAAAQHAKAVDDLAAKMDGLNSEYEGGQLSLSDYLRRLEQAASLTTSFGDEELTDLRNAIASAREEMESFTQSAEDGLASLKQEWAELNDDKLGALQIEQQQERLELEVKIAEAQAQGNSEAVNVLKEQEQLLDKIQRKQTENLQSEINQQNQKTNTAVTSTEQQLSAENTRHDETMSNLSDETAAVKNMAVAMGSGVTTNQVVNQITEVKVIETVVHKIELNNKALYGSQDSVQDFLDQLKQAGLVVS